MKKSIILLVTVMVFGIFAADATMFHPSTVMAATQAADDQTEQPKDNQGGSGHQGHH